MTKNEKHTLKYLLELQRKTDNRGTFVTISRLDVKDIDESTFITSLINLKTNEFIDFTFKSPKGDLSAPTDIYLKKSGVDYFEDKRKKNLSNLFNGLWDFLKFIVPTIISIFALIISILSYTKQ